MRPKQRYDAESIRRMWPDPAKLLTRLDRRYTRSGRNHMVPCPWHEERTPSCNVSLGRDHVRAKCHACGKGGDVIAFAMAVLKCSFQEACEHLGGTTSDTYNAPAPRAAPVVPREPERAPQADVAQLWTSAVPVDDDVEVAEMLEGRGINIAALALYDLARVLPPGCDVPRWARFDGKLWSVDYRLVVPTYDSNGAMRGMRAWRTRGTEGPKRIGRFSQVGLVMCDAMGQALLRADITEPMTIWIVEGESDFLALASSISDANAEPPAMFGVVSGAWTGHVAERVPRGSRVLVATDNDGAGNRYATEIAESLRHCEVSRWAA